MDIEGFVLIGGRSSRFGEDKAFLEFGGATLTERAAHTIKTALSPIRISLVAASENQFLPGLSFPSDLPFVFDLAQDRGPLGGLHAALSYAQSEWIFILACDYPFVSAELLRRLSSFATEDFEGVVPVQADGKLQPLFAFYRVGPCLKGIEKMLSENKTPPLHTIFQQLKTRLVQSDEFSNLPNARNFFLNLNTPEDFQRAIQIESQVNSVSSFTVAE